MNFIYLLHKNLYILVKFYIIFFFIFALYFSKKTQKIPSREHGDRESFVCVTVECWIDERAHHRS